MAQPQLYKTIKAGSPSRTLSVCKDESERAATATRQDQWVEGGPSYLDGIQATIATLTEEEKEALHLSLQG